MFKTRKGRITIPTDENYVEGTKKIADLWDADAVRDCDGVEVVEEIVTLSKVNVSVKCAEKPKQVVLQPVNQLLDFEYKDGRVFFEIKDFNCYEIVEISK